MDKAEKINWKRLTMAYSKVVLWQIGGTEKAYLFSTMPKGDKTGHSIWLPRSQIKHISREGAKANEWPKCVVEMADWLIEKHEL